MNRPRENQLDPFLTAKPKEFSQNRVNKVGKALKSGIDHDVATLDAFLTHHTHLCAKLSSILQDNIDRILLPLVNSPTPTILFGTNGYQLSARVKTLTTLIEKLKRMDKTPLNRIVDISGVRLDVDVTLKNQLRLAEMFTTTFKEHGAKKVVVKDYREQPHRGYRGIHLHLTFEAGFAEFQLRTALQSRWSNTYEEVADILGRKIRYEEYSNDLPPETKHIVETLLTYSDRSYELERKFETGNAQVISDAIRHLEYEYKLLLSSLES